MFCKGWIFWGDEGGDVCKGRAFGGMMVGTVWEGGDAWFDDGGDVLERGGCLGG